MYHLTMHPQPLILYGQYLALRRGRYKRRICAIRRRPYIPGTTYKAFTFDLDKMDDERVRSKFR